MFRKLSLFIVLAAGSVATVSIAREALSEYADVTPVVTQAPSIVVAAEPDQSFYVGSEPSDNSQREAYLRLLKLKVQQMSDEEVSAASAALDTELAEHNQEADAQLNGIVESLKKLTTEYRGTSAANAAAKALNTIDEARPVSPHIPQLIEKPARASDGWLDRL